MAWVAVVTNGGRSLLNQYAGGGHTLALTKAQAASGTVAEENLRAQTALTSVEDDASIVQAEEVTAGVQYKIQIGPAPTAAYSAKQIGLFARLDGGTETLLMIAQDSTGVSVPTAASSPSFVFALYMVLVVDNTDDLTVTIDGSAYVTQSTLEATAAELVPRDMSILTALASAPASGDLFPVSRGGDGYKIDYDALATAIISKLGGDPVTVAHGGTGATGAAAARSNLEAAGTMYLDTASWAAIYAQVSTLNVHESTIFMAANSPAVSSLLSGGTFTSTLKGIITKSESSNYDIIAGGGAGGGFGAWRISGLASGSSTPTVGTVYEYYGGTPETVRDAIGAAPKSIYLSTASWSSVYSGLSGLRTYENVCFSATTDVCELITGGWGSYTLKGNVMSLGGGTYDFLAMTGSGTFLASWRITNFTSASATPTVGTINQYWGATSTAAAKAVLDISNADIDFKIRASSAATQMFALTGTVSNSANQYYGHAVGLVLTNTGLFLWDFTDGQVIWSITA